MSVADKERPTHLRKTGAEARSGRREIPGDILPIKGAAMCSPGRSARARPCRPVHTVRVSAPIL